MHVVEEQTCRKYEPTDLQNPLKLLILWLILANTKIVNMVNTQLTYCKVKNNIGKFILTKHTEQVISCGSRFQLHKFRPRLNIRIIWCMLILVINQSKSVH